MPQSPPAPGTAAANAVALAATAVATAAVLAATAATATAKGSAGEFSGDVVGALVMAVLLARASVRVVDTGGITDEEFWADLRASARFSLDALTRRVSSNAEKLDTTLKQDEDDC